MQGMH